MRRWLLALYLIAAAVAGVAIAMSRPDPMLAVVAIVAERGHGTGFAVGARTVVTNRHVVEGPGGNARPVKVVTLLGGEIMVEAVWLDDGADLAVLTVATPLPHALAVRCAWPRRGQAVTALGHPLGAKWVAHEGRIASDLPWESDDRFAVLNLGMERGMSGGPVIDWRGRVVAVSAAYATAGGAAIGLGVPGDMVCEAIERAEKHPENAGERLN